MSQTRGSVWATSQRSWEMISLKKINWNLKKENNSYRNYIVRCPVLWHVKHKVLTKNNCKEEGLYKMNPKILLWSSLTGPTPYVCWMYQSRKLHLSLFTKRINVCSNLVRKVGSLSVVLTGFFTAYWGCCRSVWSCSSVAPAVLIQFYWSLKHIYIQYTFK